MCKATINIIFCAVLAIAILLTVFGCGERLTFTEKHLFNKDSIGVNNSFELKQNYTWGDLGSIRPYDVSKPMRIDGKDYFNAVINFDKSVKSELEVKASDNLSYKGEEGSDKTVEDEKTHNSNMYVGLFFVLALFLFLYFKTKNPIT